MSSPDSAAVDTAAAASTSLANRYGRPKRRLSRRATAILIAVGVAVLILGALAMSLSSGRSYTPTDVSFSIVSDRRTDVTEAVSMPKGTTVTCGLQVLAEDKGVVGYREATFDSADGVSDGGNMVVVQHTVPVRTLFLGVSGGAASCWKN